MRSAETQRTPEAREAAREKPALTVFLIRHGESGKDKVNPKRGLTDRGREQVVRATKELARQLILDDNPDFSDWENQAACRQALQSASQKIELHLRDSGTDRTFEQAWVEHDTLIALGLPEETMNLPRPAYQWKEVAAPTTAGPGITRRLEGVRGMDQAPEFRRKISQPEYQASLGVNDELIAWALTPEDEIPAGVENRREMTRRLGDNLGRVERVANRLANHPRDKRPIIVANSHASILTLAASDELKIPIEQLGEVENAEGLRFDFYGSGRSHAAEPFGEKLSAKAEALQPHQD